MIAISEIPAFLLGLVLLFTLAAGLGLFPLSGAMTHFARYTGFWDKFADIARHAALPVITLAMARTGGMYLLARNSMTTVLTKDYLRTARAKGLTPMRILARHTLRNAMLPIVTRIFLSLGGLVGGAILVENVFAYPGLGRLMREAVLVHDYPIDPGHLPFGDPQRVVGQLPGGRDLQAPGSPDPGRGDGGPMNVMSLTYAPRFKMGRVLGRMSFGGRTGAAILALVCFLALAAPLVCGHSPKEPSGPALAAPGPGHWMGTDELGVDIWAQVCFGGRISLLVGVGTALLAGLGRGLGRGVGRIPGGMV